MRQNLPNVIAFVVLSAIALGLMYYFTPTPPPPEPPKPVPLSPRELSAAVGGAAVLGVERPVPKPAAAAAPAPVANAPGSPPQPPAEPLAHIALGDDSFYLKVLLTNQGGGVQQVVLTRFEEANRLGREVKDAAGRPRQLHLIPGYARPHYIKLADEPPFYDLTPNYTAADHAAGRKPGPVPFRSHLTRPSYALFHYPAKDDPARPRDENGQTRPDDDNYPLPTLGERTWKVAAVKQPADGPWEVAFETELGAPYFLRVRKTFTLDRADYDFKLKVDLEPLPGRKKDAGLFRYQIAGPVGMPVEGEWYTSTYRTAYVGWRDGYGNPQRAVDDPASIYHKYGGDKHVNPGRFTYAAIGNSYFASALAVAGDYDDTSQPWEYVRPTREELPADFARMVALTPPDQRDKVHHDYEPDRAFLYDISFRAVSRPFDVAPGQPVSHAYAVYNGPLKVRLLGLMRGEDRAVAQETVERYMDAYTLGTMTDFHSPNWFGRFLSTIGWSDLVIWCTNRMHGLLWWLQAVVGNWGVTIILLTVIVRLILFAPSRHQQRINAHMQARIQKIKPELDKLQEKYRDDFLMLQQEKSKLMRRAGIRQSAQLGGCLLIFLQMPVMIGLVFCLQESVFFRLEPFLWFPNLAAPDMLAWWSEAIPFLSTPWNRVGGFSFLYLGPYFNILPVAAVALYYVQQKLTMPPPTDEQQEMQQKMMKYMLAFSALFFYKWAAGFCLYIIVTALWTLLERQLVPKPDLSAAAAVALAKEDGDEDRGRGPDRGPRPGPKPDVPPKPQGWLARKMAEAKERMEELQRQAEAQRQIRNAPPGAAGRAEPPRSTAGERAEKRKKKKRE